MNPSVMKRARTRQEAAVEGLREAIVDGVYASGQRLRQQELARQFECSVIPIREALQQLVAEGFVALDPQRGARVAAFDSRMLEEIFQVRIVLEKLAVERAAKRMTPSALSRGRHILERMERPDVSAREWVQLDWEFHDNLDACADQEYLRKTISTLRRQMEPYLRLDLAKVGTVAFGRREHRRILQACARQDADAAGRHLVAHLERTVRGFIHYVHSRSIAAGAAEAVQQTAPAVLSNHDSGRRRAVANVSDWQLANRPRHLLDQRRPSFLRRFRLNQGGFGGSCLPRE